MNGAFAHLFIWSKKHVSGFPQVIGERSFDYKYIQENIGDIIER